MPKRVLKSDVRTACKRRLDLENDDNISDDEWDRVISESYSELWSMVSEPGTDYFEEQATIVADGSASYTEPSDIFKTVMFHRIDSGGQLWPLRELMVQERHLYSGTSGPAIAYWRQDDQIYLSPQPTSGSYILTYLPATVDLLALADSDLIDFCLGEGYSFVLWDVTVKMSIRNETDANDARIEREACRQRVMEWVSNLNLTSRKRVVLDPADSVFDALDPLGGLGDIGW